MSRFIPATGLVAAAARLSRRAQTDRIDAVTGEVVRALDEAGVRAILLKGPATVRWLYPPEESRAYGDTDLLVAPVDVAVTESVLSAMGFEHVPRANLLQLRAWTTELLWVRPADGARIDLHQALNLVKVTPEEAFPYLVADTEHMDVGGYSVEILSPRCRVLTLALHAANHGKGVASPINDLERAVNQLPETLWAEAAELARRLDSLAAFGEGLRLIPEGKELATRLGLPANESVEVALVVAEAPVVAIGFEYLARARGVRAKCRIIKRALFPSRDYLLVHHPRVTDRGGIALARLWHPIWLMGALLPAVRAWRAARREVAPPRR